MRVIYISGMQEFVVVGGKSVCLEIQVQCTVDNIAIAHKVTRKVRIKQE